MTTPDKDECVRIVEAIDREKQITPEIAEMIHAAMKPKRWPLVLGRPNESLTVYAPDDIGTLPLAICEGANVARADITEPNVDRLIVNLLAQRGVDLERIHSGIRGISHTVYGADPTEDFYAIKAILSNARGEA